MVNRKTSKVAYLSGEIKTPLLDSLLSTNLNCAQQAQTLMKNGTQLNASKNGAAFKKAMTRRSSFKLESFHI